MKLLFSKNVLELREYKGLYMDKSNFCFISARNASAFSGSCKSFCLMIIIHEQMSDKTRCSIWNEMNNLRCFWDVLSLRQHCVSFGNRNAHAIECIYSQNQFLIFSFLQKITESNTPKWYLFTLKALSVFLCKLARYSNNRSWRTNIIAVGVTKWTKSRLQPRVGV